MPTILKTIAGIGRRSNIPYIGVYFVAISNNKYYIYTANPFKVLIPGYYIKIYI